MPPADKIPTYPEPATALLPASTSALPLVEAPRPEIYKLETSDRDTVPYAVLPPGFKIESLEALNGKHRPRFREGTAKLHNIAALRAYIDRFACPRCPVVYVDISSHTITAILDDDSYMDSREGSRRVDRAVVSISLDERFQQWKAFCAKRQTQRELIRFIDLNESHFRQPDGAAMRTLAAQLQVKKEMSFTNVEQMTGAARDVVLEYKTSTTERNEIKFPSLITIRIPIFAHQEKGEIPVKILFDLEEGQLFFTLRIPDENAIVEAAWEALVEELRAAMPEGLLILEGAAPAAPNS